MYFKPPVIFLFSFIIMSSISKQQLGDITTSIIKKGVDYIEDIEKNRDYFKLFWPTRADAEREDVNEWFMQRGVEALKPEQIRLVREGYLQMRWKKRTGTEESDYKAGEKLWKKIKSVVYDMMNKIYGLDTVSIPILSPPAATGIFFNHTYYFFINNLIFNFFAVKVHHQSRQDHLIRRQNPRPPPPQR